MIPLLWGGAEDVRVTSIEDSHGGASEELSAGSAEFDLWGRDMSVRVSLQSQPSRWDFFSGLKRAAPSRASIKTPSLGAIRSCVETYVVAGEVVNGGLGQHAVVWKVLAVVLLLHHY